MKKYLLLFAVLLSGTGRLPAMENAVCMGCHPTIHSEYRRSVHASSSIYGDPVHRALWERHPLRRDGNYRCAACHTPSDPSVANGKGLPKDNPIQREEPISCQGCHRIKSIEKHYRANRNRLTEKRRTFFSADPTRKGAKLRFEERSSFFGLFNSKSGSPYHNIDYGNEIWYNGNVCMGCHSHARNERNFLLCDLGVKRGDSNETCISCHMPQKPGTLANQKQSATHADHSMNLATQLSGDLSRYIRLSLNQHKDSFDVIIENDTPHTLFPHPLRLAQLRVRIERKGETIEQSPVSFSRIIGTNGKAAPSWLADSIIRDNTIKAQERRIVPFPLSLRKGDRVSVEFGYYRVNPDMAAKLGIDSKDSTQFRVMKRREFTIGAE